ncbi:hypothetical protein GOC91_22440 [Sinorhizobium medicae]|uniref:Uncharacterized protein n=2 Tax=Sinorhizobium medicae TaxID=110321 RepID=A0A6G1WP64_9HYPH|nr:hypothetical protein [Sinorhizobium medicae]MDX0522937.1 hypothetical protein [Sinorhizobium medicae]MDX0547631.1 hypothetical protein [Sinorhizobium medicae]MDX0628965.1 hypothetical protein [Sinorhizobium medicae]MDX0635293.1 hypothetical protein [Sinorhizobium medicae]
MGRHMQTRSVIEIAGSGIHLPAELIIAGYWASQTGLVVFVLNGVTPPAVNAVLDPIVVTLPFSIPGVLYVDINDEKRVREAVLFAEEIYAATRAFRRIAARCGIAPDTIESVGMAFSKLDSRVLLERIARRRSLAEAHPASPIAIGDRLGWRVADATGGSRAQFANVR